MTIVKKIGNTTYEFGSIADAERATALFDPMINQDEFETIMEDENIDFIFEFDW